MGAVTGVSALPVCLNPQLLLKESLWIPHFTRRNLGLTALRSFSPFFNHFSLPVRRSHVLISLLLEIIHSLEYAKVSFKEKVNNIFNIASTNFLVQVGTCIPQAYYLSYIWDSEKSYSIALMAATVQNSYVQTVVVINGLVYFVSFPCMSACSVVSDFLQRHGL